MKIMFRKGETGSVFEEREVGLKEAFDEVNEQIIACMVQKLLNPLQPFVTFCTRRTRSFTKYQRTATDNCHAIRAFIRAYIAKRKAGTVSSIVANQDDMLTVFLNHADTFTDELIIDELCSLYQASVATSVLISGTLLCHFIKEPTSLIQVRNEITSEIADEADSSTELSKLTLREQLDKVIDLKRVHNLEHLAMCFQEGLRFQGPAYTSSNFYLTEDAQLGNIQVKQQDEIIINYYGLHYNTKEWQRPAEFLPERWNPESPLYLTPAGKKRHAYSFVPFNGGRRSCIG